MANRTTQAAGMLLAGLLACGLSACGKKAEQAGDAAALIGEGWTAYRLSEFQNAALAFDAARASADRGSDAWAMATYGLATTWDLRRPGEESHVHLGPLPVSRRWRSWYGSAAGIRPRRCRVPAA